MMSENTPRLTYLIPRETARLLQSDVNMSKCQNMNLILARYVPHEVIRNDSVGRDKWRDKWLKDTCRRFQSNQRSEWRQIAEASFLRWQALTNDSSIVRFEGQLEDNMMVGLGGESVLETSLSLGHVDGLPFIPGTALKGISRAYALFVIAAKLAVPVLTGDALIDYVEKKQSGRTPLDILDDLLALPYPTEDTKVAKQARDVWNDCLKELNHNPYMKEPLSAEKIRELDDTHFFRLAFGSQAKAGVCVFYNAVVSNLPDGQLFVVDVMTPHYPDYYGSDGATAPSDDQGPNPIQFMTVARGTQFGFAFGINTTRLSEDDGLNVKLQERVTQWLQRGLRDMGAGAKTHAGYGLFRILE